MDTKGIIISTMEQLLKSKSFNKITVQDILDKAKVSRATFYRHFPDKYAVMNSYYEQLIQSSFSDKSLSSEERIYRIVDIVTEHKESFSGVVDVSGVNSFKNFVFNCAKTFNLNCYMQKHNLQDRKKIPPEIEMMAEFLAAGCSHLIDKWMINDPNVSTSAIYDCIMKTYPDEFI